MGGAFIKELHLMGGVIIMWVWLLLNVRYIE